MTDRYFPDKYITFKIDEFDNFVNLLGVLADAIPEVAKLLEHAPDRVEDAVVIRRQDMAAPPILDAYSSHYQALIEMIEQNVTLMPDTEITLNHLRLVATYFHEQAVISWDTERKLPD